jgi:uncharacterized protein (DUF433 family)
LQRDRERDNTREERARIKFGTSKGGAEGLMGVAARKHKIHPYVGREKGVCGGRSVIEGTRIPVWSIIRWYQLGMSLEDIIREFPQLSPSQVHDAFSYYYDNRKEIEGDIAENEADLKEGAR